jgi:hypothetical protein
VKVSVDVPIQSGLHFLGEPASGGCRHEIDPDSFLGWNPTVGKMYKCKLCGEKVYGVKLYNPPVGKKERLSKKERRRRKALDAGDK